MKANRMQVLILAGAGFLSSQAVLAQQQMDPNSLPAPSTQPNPAGQQPASSTSMQDSSNGPDMTTGMMRDKAFLHKAAEGGLAQVQLGQLATQKGGSAEVKSLGQQMVDDHTELNKQIAVVADNMGIRMPKGLNKEGKADYDRLSGLSGDDFDKEYITLLVKDHHQDLREFRMEAMATQDSNLHEAVTKGAQVIRQHMMMIDKLAKDKGIAVPNRRPPQSAAQ